MSTLLAKSVWLTKFLGIVALVGVATIEKYQYNKAVMKRNSMAAKSKSNINKQIQDALKSRLPSSAEVGNGPLAITFKTDAEF